MTLGPDPKVQTLRRQVSSGVAWGLYITVLTQVSRVVVAIVLARLLTPHEYGLAAMAFVCTSFVLSLSDASLSQALVQRPTIDELDKSTVFWTTLAIGAALTAGGFFAAGPIASFFHQPEVQPLLAVLSLSFIFTSLQMTQASLFQREMLFRLTATRFTIAIAVSSTVGLSAAALGAGAWALIAQQMAFGGTSACVLWVISPWKPRFVFSWQRLRALGGFGLNVMGMRLLGNVSTNADNLLVGRFLGSAALGVYSVAYNLMTLPIARLIVPIQDSLFPAYARVQDDKTRIAQIWHRTNAVTVAIVAPVMMGLAILSSEFVDVILGSKWSAAAPVLRILAPAAVAQSLSSLANTALLGIDRSSTVFRISLANTTLVLGAFAIGLKWGIIGIATAFTAVTFTLTGVSLLVTSVALGSRRRDLLQSLRGPLEATAAMSVAVLGARWLMEPYAVPASLRLLFLICIGAAVYVPACLLRATPVRTELGRLGQRFRRANRAVEGPALSTAEQ